jgi:conjugative relaxase-like TrwC/TraI family protein
MRHSRSSTTPTRSRVPAGGSARAQSRSGCSASLRHAAGARHRGQHIDTTGLTVASYLHATSRALDPHPHQHNVVIDAVTDTNGQPRALDARLLYRHAPTAAALATAALRWELRDLNLGWWHRDGKAWELEGITPTVIAEFSRWRNDIDEITAVLEQRLGRKVSCAETDTIALATRAPKQSINPTELLDDWQERARPHGLEPHHLDIHLTRPGATISRREEASSGRITNRSERSGPYRESLGQ